MIPLLALGVLAGSVGALLWIRSKRPVGRRSGHVDFVAGRIFLVVGLAAVVIAPVEPLRALVGFGSPARCGEKPHSRPPAVEESADVEALKAEVRHRRSEVGPRSRLRALNTAEVSRLTGPASTNRTKDRWNVFGTDLGHPFVYRGRLGFMFGDTFGNAERDHWRSNVMAWAERPAADEVVFNGMPHEEKDAEELIGSLKIAGVEQTVIPTYVVADDRRIVVHYMSVVCWGVAGSWVVDHSGLAVSHDGGRSFTRTAEPRWAGDGGFAQVAFVEEGSYVYAFGIPAGRHGPARLARAPMKRLTEAEAWRYWEGESWVADPDRAVTLVAAPVGELSVAWNETHDLWVMMYLHRTRGGIVMRTAQELTGPWSTAELVASSVDFPQLYAPYQLPPVGDGAVAYFTMSRYDLYNVLLMRTRLVDAPDLAPVVPY